ncbi:MULTISPECIES: hypothetical protein [unclassified Lysobacter]|uniref:hypothetical protein n=1 Tax=unclassified Lysobacter TaxID=2635362 RepID=UPI0006FA3DF5|nr:MULTISPECIES: hypothetical protein [unclassified Lysobacter]KRA14673.1 hypothetical protein ASD69_20285 [Lysobacter sp. Root604]KRD78715.1 hypothetical protein ASE43_19985 [Lysobacter sp. Root983]
MRASRHHRLLAACLLVFALGACGKHDDPQAGTANGEAGELLPAPQGASGGVTGMPSQPGPGQVGPPSAAIVEEPVLDENGNPILPATPEDGSLPIADDGTPLVEDGTAVPGEPTPQDAVAVVRDYYAAINARSYARAYALWSDGGRASGQSPQQFADGFADTTGVSVEILPPGRVDAAAGSRYLEVPVALTASQRDGSQRKYVGAYVLRRAVVDGAGPEQRAWRIGSADLREVKP